MLRRGQQPRTGPQNFAIGPLAVTARPPRWCRGRRRILRPRGRIVCCAFTKVNFTHSWFPVKPASEKAQLVFQLTEALLCRSRLPGSWTRGFRRLQPLAQDLLDRSGLTGEFGEAQHPRLLDAAGAHQKHGNRIFFRGSLENHRIEIIELAREFRQTAQRFACFFYTAVDSGGALKIERFAGSLAFALVFRRERRAARRQKRNHAAYFDVVIFLRAPREARCQTHFHLGIHAARKTWVAANLDLAAANLKQVEKSGGECIRRSARGKRAEIKSVRADPPRGVAPRISIRQADLEHRGRTQPQPLAVLRRPKCARVLPVQETQLKRRAD